MHPGQAVRFTFDRIGTYRNDCSFHPQSMKGTVIVSGT
jgi:plastocyanin